MANTTMSDMINPQVMGDMIDSKITSQLKLTPYAKVDTTLVGVPGNTITVPSWNYVGDAEDIAEGAEVGTTAMTSSTSTFTIKKAMKNITLTQEAVNSGLGNPVGQATTQLSKSIAGKVDSDVLDAAYTATTVYVNSTLAAISYDEVVSAVTKFEDEEDGIDKVMFIHPAQEATLLKDDDFLSADKFTAGVAVNGSIGKIAGCWVKKSNKVKLVAYEKNESGTITIVADATAEDTTNKHLSTVQPGCINVLAIGDKVNAVTTANQYYMCPIIKLEPDSADTEYTEDELPALTIYLKKDTQTDTEFKAKSQLWEITTSKYYGVALTNAAKVVLAKFKK